MTLDKQTFRGRQALIIKLDYQDQDHGDKKKALYFKKKVLYLKRTCYVESIKVRYVILNIF